MLTGAINASPDSMTSTSSAGTARSSANKQTCRALSHRLRGTTKMHLSKKNLVSRAIEEPSKSNLAVDCSARAKCRPAWRLMQNRCAPINRICCRSARSAPHPCTRHRSSLYLSVVWTNIWNTRCATATRARAPFSCWKYARAECLHTTTTTCIIFERGTTASLLK